MKRKASPLPPVPGTVATRTRRQEKNAAAKWNQPLSVIINILLYADPETVRILCLLSKQFLDIIRNSPAMKNHRVIPLLQISPSESREDDGRPERLVHQLYHHRAKLQHYRAIKFIGVKKFCYVNNIVYPPGWTPKSATHLSNTFQLHGVVSLDISSSTGITEDEVLSIDSCALPNYLTDILPNLLEINCSNRTFHSKSMRKFCRMCPRLERITWNNIKFVGWDVTPTVCGSFMHDAKNLKEIYMDDCEFFCSGFDYQKFMNLDGDPHSYIFHCCSKINVLVRLSIKNADVIIRSDWDVPCRFEMKFCQDILIKFVRKAPPSLKWFRSDLTQGNINMLQLERPEIEFVA